MIALVFKANQIKTRMPNSSRMRTALLPVSPSIALLRGGAVSGNRGVYLVPVGTWSRGSYWSWGLPGPGLGVPGHQNTLVPKRLYLVLKLGVSGPGGCTGHYITVTWSTEDLPRYSPRGTEFFPDRHVYKYCTFASLKHCVYVRAVIINQHCTC